MNYSIYTQVEYFWTNVVNVLDRELEQQCLTNNIRLFPKYVSCKGV